MPFRASELSTSGCLLAVAERLNDDANWTMTTERRKEISRRANLPRYLKQLSMLAGRQVRANDLVPVKALQALREKLSSLSKTPVKKFCIRFENRISEAFTCFVNQLGTLNSSPVYLWLSQSNECGLLELPSVARVNFAFPFDSIPEGVVVIVTADGADRLLFDFSEEGPAQQSLTAELYGSNWPSVAVPEGR